MPDGLDTVEISRRGLREGVLLAPGNFFSVGGLAPDFLRFNVAQCGLPRSFDVLRDAMAPAGPRLCQVAGQGDRPDEVDDSPRHVGTAEVRVRKRVRPDLVR